MRNSRNVGTLIAVGVGLRAVLAASVGPIGYLIGLAGCLGTVALVHEVRRR